MEDENQKKEQIASLLESIFRSHGYSPLDNFDYNIWFIEHSSDNKISAEEYYTQLLTETPKEDDDIIKFMLFNSFKKSKENSMKKHLNPSYSISVSVFIDELTTQIINLNKRNAHLNELIAHYNAYETINTLKQNMINFHKYEERTTEITKSIFYAAISTIKNIPKGDYQFSLLITQISTEDSENQRQYEYILKHIVHIHNDVNEITYEKNEFEFPDIEFFCIEQKGTPKFESGTNLSNFQLKMINLSKKYSEPILSEKFKFIELLIGNSEKLMNNYEKVKNLEANISLKNAFYDVEVKLKVSIEFDPITLMAFYDKMNNLLKNIISFKIRIEHKYKTIMNYFDGIEEKVEYIINPKEVKNDCLIF